MSHIHDAPVDKSTISGGLGLTNACFDSIAEDCVQAYKDQDSISDTLLVSGNQIREEELDVPGNLSRYEKKLLLAGYFVGKIHSGVESKHQAIMKMMGKMMGDLGLEKSKDQEGED
jgi:hypothetical protein